MVQCKRVCSVLADQSLNQSLHSCKKHSGNIHTCNSGTVDRDKSISRFSGHQPSSTYSWTLFQGNKAGSISEGHTHPPLTSMHAPKHACMHIAHSLARDGSPTPMTMTPFEVWLSWIINRISNRLTSIYKMCHPVQSTIIGSPAAGRYLVGYETQRFTVFPFISIMCPHVSYYFFTFGLTHIPVQYPLTNHQNIRTAQIRVSIPRSVLHSDNVNIQIHGFFATRKCSHKSFSRPSLRRF